VSLWYQAPQNTFEPRDSRSIGWSQVPNRRAVLLDDDKGSPQRSTGGGTQLDLSNTLRFGDMNTAVQLDPTINFAQFGFENFQELTAHQYQMISNMSFSESLNQIENIYTILDSGATTSVTVITGASLTTVGASTYLRFTTTTLNFTGGLITSTAAGSNIDIATATCT
jgi:hypothetical protein